jgi:hypothetical protein
MSDAPDRIWINKVHGQHPEDWNFTDGQHLTKRQLSDKVEYVHSDRIEALTAMLNTVSELWAKEATEKNVLAGRCENLKAKLAKAVETTSGPSAWLDDWAIHVGRCRGGDKCSCGLSLAQHEARATLAELKG